MREELSQQKFELYIEHTGGLSWLELREVVAILDEFILEFADPFIAEDIFYSRYRQGRRPRFSSRAYEFGYAGQLEDFTFVEVEEIRGGSIVLIVTAGAATFTLGAIAAGLRRSRLPRELSRLGENTGNILAEGLSSVNSRLEEWSETNMRLRDRKTKVKLKKLDDKSE